MPVSCLLYPKPFIMNNKKTKGSALLTALFIMTIVAIIATAMTTRLQVDIYRTRLLINSDRLYLASQSGAFWAMDALKKQTLNFTAPDKRGAIAHIPKSLQALHPEIKIEGSLFDLQAKFNINMINEKKFTSVFLNLTTILLSNQTAKERKSLILAIQNWISPYQPDRGKDQYLSTYLQNKPPYLPGHQPFSNISELRLVHGVNQSIYQQLLPYLTALPDTDTAININTASKPVLMSLGNGLNEARVQELLKARGDKGFKKMKDVEPLLKKLNLSKEQITLESRYYLSVTTVRYDKLQLVNYSILMRKKGKKKNNQEIITVMLMSETINSL